MANPQIETVSTGADKAKLAAAGILVIAAVTMFYVLGKQDMWVRVVSLLVLLVAAVGAFFTSESGKQLIAFGRDSAREVRKVVWPTRKETMQVTGVVILFVIIMALFLWLVDGSLTWLVRVLMGRNES